MEEYLYVYNQINNGGIITAEVLCHFVNTFSDLDDKWTSSDCRKIIRYINKTINKRERVLELDLPGFLLFLIPICKKKNISIMEVREFFEFLDEDRDGFITYDEFVGMIYKLHHTMHPEEILKYRNILLDYTKKIDRNSDGKISYDEFKKFIVNFDFYSL
jgi:Ca2+-binding EF-hand superfamily protein